MVKKLKEVNINLVEFKKCLKVIDQLSEELEILSTDLQDLEEDLQGLIE